MQFEPRDFQDTVYRVCTYQGNIQGAAGEKKQLVYKEAVPNEHDTRIHTLVIILGALSFKSNSGCLRTHPSFQHWLGSYSTMSQRTKNRPRLIAHTAHRGLKDIWKQDYTMQKKMLQQIEELTINLRFKHPFGNTPPHTHTHYKWFIFRFSLEPKFLRTGWLAHICPLQWRCKGWTN